MSVGQRKKPLARSPMKRGRKRSDRDRVYGPRDFRDWLHQQPCIITGQRGVECVHVKGGGVSRKAGYEWTVPMTALLHRELHQHGIRTFEAKYDVDLELAAIAIQQRWLAHLARTAA